MYSKQALYTHNVEGRQGFKLTKAFRCDAVKISLCCRKAAGCRKRNGNTLNCGLSRRISTSCAVGRRGGGRNSLRLATELLLASFLGDCILLKCWNRLNGRLLCLAFHLRLRCDISNFNRDGAFGRFRCSETWRCGIRQVLLEVSTESSASFFKGQAVQEELSQDMLRSLPIVAFKWCGWLLLQG